LFRSLSIQCITWSLRYT